MVAVTNPPKGMPSTEGYVTLHKGFAASDCTAPVLMAGPDIALNPVPEGIWLHRLDSKVLQIDPLAAQRSAREPNRLTVTPFEANLTLSPACNLLLHAELGADNSAFVCETDPFRSFNARIWIGAGIVNHSDYSMTVVTPALSALLEVFIGWLVVDWRALRSGGKAKQHLSATYEAQSGFTVRRSFLNQIGLGLTW